MYNVYLSQATKDSLSGGSGERIMAVLVRTVMMDHFCAVCSGFQHRKPYRVWQA